MFSRFQDQLLANLSSVRQFLLPSLLFCLGLFRLVISNLTLKFFLGIFRVALLFICQGTVCFVLRSRLPSLEVLSYYIVSISFCQALFSFFFSALRFRSLPCCSRFPVRSGVLYYHTPTSLSSFPSRWLFAFPVRVASFATNDILSQTSYLVKHFFDIFFIFSQLSPLPASSGEKHFLFFLRQAREAENSYRKVSKGCCCHESIA